MAASWAGVCGDDGSSGCVGEEDWGLGAGETVSLIASTAACSGEGGSCGEDGEETELGAGGGEEWSGVQTVVDSNSCGVLGRERVYAWFGGTAGVGLGGDQVGGGGECGGGERCRSSSLSTPLSSSTSQRLFAAFLVRFAGGGEGAGGVSGGDGWGGGCSAGGGSGWI